MDGQTVLITGASGFLGQHMVEVLLSNGATVLATDLNKSHNGTKNTSHHRFHYFSMDVGDLNEVKTTFDQIYDQNLFPNTIINNAAINPKVENKNITSMSRLENYDLAVWNEEINVGLTGAFIVTQCYLSKVLEDGIHGNIINIASDLGVIAPDQRLYREPTENPINAAVKPASYSVIKHGLVGFTKYLATYYPELIRANSISPSGFYNNQDEGFVTKLVNLIPKGRMAELNDINGILLLLCDEKSEYITGQNIVVDGGRSTW
jgi:NAD(P)-dependent dehydrogenase (short-subunit alcohol dehydrogenase family)